VAGFIQGPCESREELFDRDEELEMTLKCIRNGVWVAILGPRMSGKTSLAKVSANILREEGYESIYVNLIGVKGVRECAERKLGSIPRSFIERIGELKGFLEALGVKIGLETKLKPSTSSTKVLEKFFFELSRREKLVVILDEVQEIKGGIGHFLTLLYRLRTTTRNLSFIFTGSAIGLMKTLLNPSPKNPMYGRTPVKVELKPWSMKLALEFLEQGLKKCNMRYGEEELEEAIRELGTLPGWLSFYGLRRCVGKPHEKALKEAKQQAIDIARKELQNMLKNRGEWTRKALRMLALGSRWTEILRETRISRKALRDLLQTLKNLYLVTEENGVYRITDPIYRQAALKL